MALVQQHQNYQKNLEDCGHLNQEQLNAIVGEINTIFEIIQSRSGGANKENKEEEQEEVNSVYSSGSSIS